ncbi:MAG: HupE/UreJ family protein [Planctomycetota bacterium]|jgi:hydrogenase/urease accessory protein HupE
MIRGRFSWVIVALLAIWAVPQPAEAHLVNTGFGPFYDGIMHLFVTPADLITVLAIAMFAGLRGAASARYALFLLAGGWMVGGYVTLLLAQGDIDLPLVAALAMLVGGLLVAVDVRMPISLVATCAAVAGLFCGTLNGAAMAASSGGMRAVFGVTIAVFVIASITSAVVVSKGIGWPRIVVRVAGSWITAIGLLMAGWALKSG